MFKLLGMLVFGVICFIASSAVLYVLFLFLKIIIGGITNADYLY